MFQRLETYLVAIAAILLIWVAYRRGLPAAQILLHQYRLGEHTARIVVAVVVFLFCLLVVVVLVAAWPRG
jgi:hypothetical protein